MPSELTESLTEPLCRSIVYTQFPTTYAVFHQTHCGSGRLRISRASGHGNRPTAFGRDNPRLGIDTTNFDHSVRPQDDFFRFVNGRWLAKTQIPADASSWGAFNELTS